MQATRTLVEQLENDFSQDSIEIRYLDHEKSFQIWNGMPSISRVSICLVGLIPQIIIVDEIMGESGPEDQNLSIMLSEIIAITVEKIQSDSEEPYVPVACWVQNGGDLLRFSR